MSPELVTELFHKYYKELCFFANGLLGSSIAEEGCDVVQDVFLKLAEFDRDEIRNHKAFLIDLVKKKCYNITKAKRNKNSDAPEWLENNLLSEDFADSLAIKADLLNKLRAVYENLPLTRKKIFEMIYFQKMTLNEIAAELNLSVNTVYVQKNRIDKAFGIFEDKSRWINQAAFKTGWQCWQLKSRVNQNRRNNKQCV